MATGQKKTSGRRSKLANNSNSTALNANASQYVTEYGKAFLGDSLDVFDCMVDDNSVDLIITSPPYALLEKKSYGNKSEQDYAEWFLPFAHLFKRKLREAGSLVINWGGAWLPKKPVRSLYIYRLLIRLHDEVGLHLCQEFYWYNPAKLPAPIEWVNKRRVRVKDSVEQIYWLSPSPNPKANNRNVLMQYSKSMERLIKTKSYNWGERPSGHVIGKKWGRDNQGAISPNLILHDEALIDAQIASATLPGNLLVQSNTASTADFLRKCRENGLPLHPARFPAIIPEYFIRFLTDDRDLVCDPFAGSNTTGFIAETMNRRWISCELDPTQFLASSLRFPSVVWSGHKTQTDA